MPEVLFPLDSSKPFTEQEKLGHNRWHPDIPPVETLKPGDSFRADCREWFDGAIKNDDSADDIRDAPMSKVHALSGPFAIEGAEPGDLLVVDILDVGPIPQEEGPLAGQGWGYTGIFAKQNGGSFLVDPEIYLSQPGLGGVLGARVLAEFGDDPQRYADARARKNYSGMSPITRASGKKQIVIARYARNRRLGDAHLLQAFAALNASPGARAYYDARRTRGATHYQALRAVANRLVGILHGCLRNHALYDEQTAWHTPAATRPETLAA